MPYVVDKTYWDLVENILSKGQKDLSILFLDDKAYEIAFTLELCLEKEDKFYDEDLTCINNYLDWLDFPIPYLKKVLEFMIRKWLASFYFLQDKFDIDTSDFSLSVFLEGFDENLKNKDWIHSFSNPFLLWKLVSLCQDKEKLLYEIMKKGYFMQVFILFLLSLNKEHFSFPLDIFSKLSEKDADLALSNFEKIISKLNLRDKLTFYWYVNWFDLVEVLFENPDKAFEKIKEIFSLSDEEKEEFDYLKQEDFFPLYEEIKNDIKEEIEQLWMNITHSFNFTDIYEWEYNEKLEKIITEITASLNYESKYIIQFVDITGQNISISIWNKYFFYGTTYTLFEVNNFISQFKRLFNFFLENLQNNNIDFCIYIAKNAGSKDPTTDEENFKLAA